VMRLTQEWLNKTRDIDLHGIRSCLVGWLVGWSRIQRSVLSIRNGVLLYKQFVRPVKDYACPIWRSTASTHSRELQVLQSKCVHIASIASWYTGHGQILEDLGVLFFADHIRSLTERFSCQLMWVTYQLGISADVYADWVLTQVS